MIQYGFENYAELTLNHLHIQDTVRRGPWMDLYLGFSLDQLPPGLVDPSVKVILNEDKAIIEMVVLDEGCDSEYKLTELEKEQIYGFLKSENLVPDQD